MNKRILTLVLALVMILGLAVTSFAAPEVEKITNPKVQWLIDKNIVVGRLQDDGKTTVYDLDKTITREEVAKLVILYRGSENLARSLQGTKGIFKDVAIDRWSNGYINVAALADLIVGYPDGNFGPDKDITYAEIAAILVRMNSKWTAADEKAAIWPISFIKAAEEFGILKGVKIEDANAPAVREKVFEMMYNAFDGKYQAPIVNDRLGVVSKIWGNSIQLNGKDEYKVTDKTIFVGNTLNVLFKSKDFFGSLVRVAVNNDNEITHLIALGNGGVAQKADKWDEIAEYVYSDSAAADITKKSDNDKVVFANGLELKITDKTRFFVADSDNNNFFEAKKLSDAIDTSKPAHLKGVYAGYDKQPVTGDLFAKVVVFSTGKVAKADKNLARITASVGVGYDFRAEDTKAVETEYSVAKANKFPYNYKLHKMDVVNLHMSGDKDVVDFETVIDYDSAPVYEVVKIDTARYQKDGTIKFEGNYIKLKDKHDQEREFALDVDGVSVFTNTLRKGDHVQVSYKKDTNEKVIDVISRVDLSLRDEFPGYVPRQQCGILDNITVLSSGEYKSITLWDGKDSFTYEINKAKADELKDLIDDAKAYGTGAYEENKNIRDKNIGICVTTAKGNLMDVVTSVSLDDAVLKANKKCEADAKALIAKMNAAAAVATPATSYDETDATQKANYEAALKLVAEYDAASKCVQDKVYADATSKTLIDDTKAITDELAARPGYIDEVKAEAEKLEAHLKKTNIANASDLLTEANAKVDGTIVTLSDNTHDGNTPPTYGIKLTHVKWDKAVVDISVTYEP